MKKVYSLFVSVLMACSFCALTSCEGEEEELIEEDTISQFTKDIVGKWKLDNTEEYWRFDAQGSGSVGYGENWDMSEDVNEGEGNTFQWYIEANGLMVIYAIGGQYNDPEPDAPYVIKSITSTRMTWVTSSGHQQTLVRQ